MTLFTLASICSRLSSGKSIPAARIKADDKYPVLGGNGPRGYTDEFNFEGDCAVIGRQGAACGNVRFFSGRAYMTEHAVVACTDNQHDARYLAYLLSTMHLGRLSAQSAQPGLSVKTLSMQIVDMPSLETQQTVATILKSLDSKIELNNRINDYLEELVGTEFEQRFGAEENTVPLEQVLSISTKSVNPQKHPGDTWEHYSIPSFDEARWPTFELADGIKSNKYIVDGNTILISKLNPSTKRVWMPFCLTDSAVCSTEFIVYKPEVASHKSFYYAMINSASFSKFLMEHVTGSTGSRQRTQPKATLTFPAPNPGYSEIEKYCSFADPLLSLKMGLQIESQRLKSLRDALLPKLMSGEIDVSQIDLTQLNNRLSDC